MSAITGIEWTDRTWNPVTGCTKVSPGCAHCYAEGVAERFWVKQYPWIDERPVKLVARPRQFTDVQTHEDRLLDPLSWRKPSKVFVNSMSDLFHEDVPDAFILSVFSVMERAPRHTFQILTKRPERMCAFVMRHAEWVDYAAGAGEYLRRYGHVWLGVSVENQHFADERIPLLLQTPAAVRFISAEPLLGHVNLIQFMAANYISQGGQQWRGAGGIGWCIVGGESGHGARPFRLEWARSIIQQCQAAGVPVFMKQLGAVVEMPASGNTIQIQRGKNNDPAFWPDDLRVREFPLEAHR